MKSLILVLAASAFMTSCGSEEPQEGETSETFTVYGNCGMCEKTIEGSLSDVEGVRLADWNKEDDQLSVIFTEDVISLDDIKQKVADVGYDSDSHRAKDKVYSKLPECCRYDRPE